MPEPTRTPKGYLAVMLTASGATFLAMLDSTVTNIAIPNVRHDFPASTVTGLSWIISAYAVMFAAFLAPSGKLADALGRRRLFVLGVGLFTLSSAACAVAPGLPLLIAFRAVQGAGAAAMIPASLAILLLDGPADRRANSIGLWSAASAVGAAIGPALGGVLIEWSSWRAVFVINIPFGIALVIAALRVLRVPETVSASRVPDPLGTVLLALGVGALTLGVTEGGIWGWLSVRTLACFAFGLFALGYALLRSRRAAVPAIETSLWASRTFTATNVVSLLYGMAQYPFMLASVLYLTGIWRFSELQAGGAMTPGAVSASIVALNMGRITDRIGVPRASLPRFATLAGLAAFAACAIWLIFGLTIHPAFLTLWFPAALLAGLGMGATTMGTSASAAMSAPPVMFASSSGLNTTARQFGGALGIATMATILTHGGHLTGSTAAYSHVFF